MIGGEDQTTTHNIIVVACMLDNSIGEWWRHNHGGGNVISRCFMCLHCNLLRDCNLQSHVCLSNLERLANMYELSEIASRYDTMPAGEALERFLEDVALASDQDSRDDSRETVKLMTIHAAKGLEFGSVFVSGCEEALFSPNHGDDNKKDAHRGEEERRLFYVAMTRAKEHLLLSWASVRTIFGSQEINMLCNFVLDIPESMIESTGGFSFGAERFVGEDDDEEIIYLDF